jgi:hypothetical protein
MLRRGILQSETIQEKRTSVCSDNPRLKDTGELHDEQ